MPDAVVCSCCNMWQRACVWDSVCFTAEPFTFTSQHVHLSSRYSKRSRCIPPALGCSEWDQYSSSNISSAEHPVHFRVSAFSLHLCTPIWDINSLLLYLLLLLLFYVNIVFECLILPPPALVISSQKWQTRNGLEQQREWAYWESKSRQWQHQIPWK